MAKLNQILKDGTWKHARLVLLILNFQNSLHNVKTLCSGSPEHREAYSTIYHLGKKSEKPIFKKL